MPLPEPLPAFDLYAELGLGRAADSHAIEVAWRTAMRRHHPDIAGGGATPRAVRLNIAREWLLDPARRARYDAFRWPASIPAERPVDVPAIDPLGAWPARRRRQPPKTGPIAAIALMFVLTGLTLGPVPDRTGFLGSFLFSLGLFVLAWIAFIGLIRMVSAPANE
jgi:curved DNA-binding protein CbpA